MKRMIGLALVTSAALAVSSQAAYLTLDLRAADGSKTVNLASTASGQAVTLNLYAQVQNLDSDHTNDGVNMSVVSLLSTEAAQASLGAFGNMSTFTFATGFGGLGSSAGTVRELDGHSDLELGSTSTASSYWVNITSSSTPINTFGTGSGSGLTEILLGTVTWTSLSGNLDGSFTNVQLALRNITSTKLYKGMSDGVSFAEYSSGSVAVGDAVTITLGQVPEPACLSLLALGAVGLLARRRK